MLFPRLERGHSMSNEAFDSYGVPTFYVNVAVPEAAGGGNVRIWNCVRKRGVLVPVCEIIIPATDLVIAARAVSATAQDVFNCEMMGATAH